jgi:hypothetical protein
MSLVKKIGLKFDIEQRKIEVPRNTTGSEIKVPSTTGSAEIDEAIGLKFFETMKN